MTGLTSGTDVYTYAYNGLGDRYQQTVNGVSTTYQLDLAANLVQVLNDGDNSYLYGLNRIAQVSSTQTGYFLPDALGSVRQVVDPQADLQLSRSYTPFGEELTSSGSYETPFGFAGEQHDASGLLYLRARYLSTSTGRFTSVDPFSGYLNYPASINPYQYAYNNPLRYVDPSGESVFVNLGLIGGKLFGQYLNKNCLSMADVGRAMLAGTAAIVVGIAVGMVVGALGVALLPGSLFAAVIFGAAGGVLAGQYSRLVSNLILGRAPSEGMFNAKDMLVDGVLGGVGGAVGFGLAKLVKAVKAAKTLRAAGNSIDDVVDGKYLVGEYQAIKGKPGLDAHHVGQKSGMELFIENYDPNTAPAINVPKVGHTIKGPNGIVSRSLKGITSARELLIRDIVELLRVYDDIPDSAIIELIELNLKKYPEMRY